MLLLLRLLQTFVIPLTPVGCLNHQDCMQQVLTSKSRLLWLAGLLSTVIYVKQKKRAVSAQLSIGFRAVGCAQVAQSWGRRCGLRTVAGPVDGMGRQVGTRCPEDLCRISVGLLHR